MKSPLTIYTLILVLLLSITTHALQAPYIISATALSDSSVQLNIRNSDFSSKGFHVLRKITGSSTFNLISSIEDTSSVVIDNGLLPEISYNYSVLAFNDTEISDTSNVVEVTTLPLVEIFKSPEIISLRWGFDTGTVKIQFYDSSNCEQGFHFYRSKNFGPYEIVGAIGSSYPKYMGEVQWIDKNLDPNSWYKYVVAVTKPNNGGGLTSEVDTVYTLHASSLLNSLNKITLLEKLSSIPIDFKGWVMHAGDTILLTENNAPDSCYSILNIKDRKHPKFEGYKKTEFMEIVNSIYEEKTPWIVGGPSKYPYYITDTKLFKAGWENFYQFEYISGDFKLIDSINWSVLKQDSYSAYMFNGIIGMVNEMEIVFSIYSYHPSYPHLGGFNYARLTQNKSEITFLNDRYSARYGNNGNYWDRIIINNILYYIWYSGWDSRRRVIISDYSIQNNFPIISIGNSVFDENLNHTGPADSLHIKEINKLASYSIKNDYAIESLSPDYRCLFVDTSKSQVIIAYQDSLVIYECLIDDSNPISFNKKPNKNFINKISFSSISNSTIKINNPTLIEIKSAKVFDLSGRLIKDIGLQGERKKSVYIDINNNAANVYLIKVFTNRGSFTSKVSVIK